METRRWALNRVDWCALNRVDWCAILLCSLQTESGNSDEEGSDNPVQSRALALLDEMSRHRRGDKESEELQETVALLEDKCEKLQDDLANVR